MLFRSEIANKYRIRNIEDNIKYLCQFENNRQKQAYIVILSLASHNKLDSSIKVFQQGEIYSYIVPFVELVSGYIALFIDLTFKCNNIQQQRNDLLAFEKMAEMTYKLDTSAYHILMRNTPEKAFPRAMVGKWDSEHFLVDIEPSRFAIHEKDIGEYRFPNSTEWGFLPTKIFISYNDPITLSRVEISLVASSNTSIMLLITRSNEIVEVRELLSRIV